MVKIGCIVLFYWVFFSSCDFQAGKKEDEYFVDSLIHHFTLPNTVGNHAANLEFWKQRIDPKLPGQVSESRYAGALTTRFHDFGNIQDLDSAEKIINGINTRYHNTLASPFTALVSESILRHRFSLADTFLQKATLLGIDGFTRNTLSFDVDFEVGKYSAAGFYLKQLKTHKDYAYYFRKSKWEHLQGNIDSAIRDMLHASLVEPNEPYLRGIAFSNAADLYTHQGELEKAGALYRASIRLNPLDMHSILGLSWIILENDHNPKLAKALLDWVKPKNKLPDVLFRLYQYAQEISDTALEKKYALEFEASATDSSYGKMYNKYLIELYTGILHYPEKALYLAKNELSNRAIPPTYAWYAFTLLQNSKSREAYDIYKAHVSGKPLESLELYYMGCLFRDLKKGYTAMEFFKAAQKNRFDLSPFLQRNIKKYLEE